MPNALLEAMAANCVPITGEIGGIAREIIEDEGQGFVLAEHAPAPTLEQLIDCSASSGPRERIKDHFDLSQIARRYETIYAALLQAP
jgi:glycosyltransferase involved in cell wall biosynthesis